MTTPTLREALDWIEMAAKDMRNVTLVDREMAVIRAALAQPVPDAIHWPQVVAYPGGNGGLGAWVDISTGDGPEHVQRFYAAAHPQPAPLTDALPVLKRAADWMRDRSGCCALKGIACRCSGDCSVIAVHKEVTATIASINAERGIVPAPTTDTKEQQR
jgi:hypothetical protein